MLINIAIVEDDAKSAEMLSNFCKQYSNETAETIKSSIFKNGVEFLEQYSQVDIIFMDIEMPLMDGLQTAKKLRQIDSKVIIIFVTNMAHYAIKGYEVDAMDFIVKPANYYNFAFKLKKAVSFAKLAKASEIIISFDRGIKKIDVSDIHYVENLRHRLLYHTALGELEENSSLVKAEKNLAKHGFARCNSYYLVNLAHVSEIKNTNVVVDGKELPMSRARKKEFIAQLTTFVGGSN